MKPPPELTIPPPVASINTIPDELLLKILAFVPYPGQTVLDSKIAIKQHDDLKVVSSRFNSIMSTATFRMELLRSQYNDEVQLYGSRTSPTLQNLRELVVYAAKIDALVDRMFLASLNNATRSMLRIGVLILDYLKYTNIARDIKTRMMFIEWVKKDLFSSSMRIMLRYTLKQLHETTFQPDILQHAIRFAGLAYTVADMCTSEAQIKFLNGMLQMYKHRSFETFVLLVQPSGISLPAMLNVMDADSVHIRRQGWDLIQIFTAVYLGPLARADSGETTISQSQSDFAHGYQWRLLSDRALLPQHSRNHGPNVAVKEIFQSEMFSDLRDEEYIKYCSSFPGAELDVAGVCLKSYGEFLRNATARIAAGDEDIPKEIKKSAEEAALLSEG